MCQHFGVPSVFLTFTPDDINNPTSFRLAFRSAKNADFPADAPEEFFRSMENETVYLGGGDIRVPADYPGRLETMRGHKKVLFMDGRRQWSQSKGNFW